MRPPRQAHRHGLFILLRRLRQPLIVLILVYATAVLGFTMVEGVDPSGAPWRMGFLHAFYFVSFLGTTIGLGEIPYPFSDAQRLWATASIYGTVVAWLYAIGALFSVLQDPMFRRIVREGSFERQVRRLDAPFYLLCGYDDTGHRVARELTENGSPVVVIDIDAARVELVDVEDLQAPAPALEGDASDPRTLVLAGLRHPLCAGLLALTGSDTINTKIALTARMLNPELEVLSAAHDHLWHPRLAAAGATHIINPSDTFAERVAMSIRTPSLHVIYEALTTQLGTAMDEPPALPEGPWLLCGSGQFVRSLQRQLREMKIRFATIAPDLDADADHGFRGDPTDPGALRRAGAEDVAVVVAGTDVDIDNLSITLAAHGVNKRATIMARQTQRRNSLVFRESPAKLVTLSGYVVAAEVLRRIRSPLLSDFLRRARDESEDWAHALLQRLRAVVGAEVLESWSIRCDGAQAPHLRAALGAGRPLALGVLLTDPQPAAGAIAAVPLLVQRGRQLTLLPSADWPLQVNDTILLCGSAHARAVTRYLARSPVVGASSS